MRNYSTILTLIVLIAFAGCDVDPEVDTNGNSNDNRTRVVAVETIIVEPREFRDGVDLTGTAESMNDAVISAEASGRVLEIKRRGSVVSAGDVVAQLDEELLESAVEVARANFEAAQDAFERQEPLFDEGIISPLEFNTVRSQRDQTRAQLRQAERQLNNATITAPFNGRVEQRMVEIGELLTQGSSVVRLVNTGRVKVTAGVPDRYSNEVDEGSEVTLQLSNYGGASYETVVSFAGNVINDQTRTFPIEVELDNPEGTIKPQMTIDLFVTSTILENAITVPRTALVRDQTGQNLYIVNRENDRPVAEYRSVTTGRATSGNILILDGLSSGDEVIVAGLSNLSPGDVVRVDETTNG
ncbi:MAG: efflux RND transporter periplasmic adaptor subunit, partial [Balneolales bacterium]